MSILNNSLVSIDTVVPAINLGDIMISADRKSTKEKPLTDAERIRRIVLPANHWGNIATTLNGETSQSLNDVLRAALKSIAGDRLRDALATDPLIRSIELSGFTVSELLKWSTETAVSRGSISFTRDDATNWFAKSETAKAMLEKHGAKAPAKIAFLMNRFGALAAKNHGLKDEAEAAKLMSIIDEKDLLGESAALVAEISGRLEHIIKQLKAKAAEETVSMDDI